MRLKNYQANIAYNLPHGTISMEVQYSTLKGVGGLYAFISSKDS
jgi:hypothetical protein